MSEFLDRISLNPNDDSFIGTAEVHIVDATTSEQAKIERLTEENPSLRDRLAEATRRLAEAGL
jgi:dynactin complex subunit